MENVFHALPYVIIAQLPLVIGWIYWAFKDLEWPRRKRQL